MNPQILANHRASFDATDSIGFLIDQKIKWLCDVLGLTDKDWPLDCVRLIEVIKNSQCITFHYRFCELPIRIDAVSVYVPEHKVYLLQINRGKLIYPFRNSGNRRMNFTLAHELGHIFLGHLLVPRNTKSFYDLSREEAEADEFAGRLLMPKHILFSCNFHSASQVAAYLNVSKSALWTRLQKIDRQDLISRRRIPTCSCCGNTSFSSFSQFCGICGHKLRGNLNGIRRIYYPSMILLDKHKRVLTCPSCHAETDFYLGDKCKYCGTNIFNYCTGFYEGECTYAGMSNHLFCESCGKATYFNAKHFLDENLIYRL